MRANAMIAGGLAAVAMTFGGLGVALAGDGTSAATQAPPPADLQFTQDQPDQQRPDDGPGGRDRRDCPKDRQGDGGGGSSSSSEAPSGDTSV